MHKHWGLVCLFSLLKYTKSFSLVNFFPPHHIILKTKWRIATKRPRCVILTCVKIISKREKYLFLCSYYILYYLSSNLDLFMVTTLTWWVDRQTAASFHHLWPMAAVWSDSLQICLKGLFCWDESLHFTAVNSWPAALRLCMCLWLCGCEDEIQLSGVFCPSQFFMWLKTKNYHNLTPHRHHLHMHQSVQQLIEKFRIWSVFDRNQTEVDARLKFHKKCRD